MKKVAYIILIVTLVMGSLQVFQGRAGACGPNSLMIIFEPLPMFRYSGQFVEYTAAAGGIIGGIATGIVAGIPMGIAGCILTAPLLQAKEGGFIGLMIPVMIGKAVGQVAVGSLVMIPKFLFYDVPMALISPEKYEKYEKVKLLSINDERSLIPIITPMPRYYAPIVKYASPTPMEASPRPPVTFKPQRAK